MEFLDEIKAKFPNVLESVDGSNENESVLLLKDKTKIKRVCKEVKNHFDILFMLMAVDKPPKIFELNYVFSSYKTQNILTIRVNIERDKAVIDSISSLFESADWEERETYDLFGVEFIGHKNLKRILLPEDWPGRPLRKDFEVTDEVRNWTGLDLKF
jgi:NADH-quinone oxidoreductase subunit C